MIFFRMLSFAIAVGLLERSEWRLLCYEGKRSGDVFGCSCEKGVAG